MPTPHLHPRSRMTSSLFATTLLASFFVVALPHILPCPAPRRALADDGAMASASPSSTSSPADPRRRRRRRDVQCSGEGGSGSGSEDGMAVVEFRPGAPAASTTAAAVAGQRDDGKDANWFAAGRAKRGRECPVPKPGGILGEWLGFTGGTEKEVGVRTKPER